MMLYAIVYRTVGVLMAPQLLQHKENMIHDVLGVLLMHNLTSRTCNWSHCDPMSPSLATKKNHPGITVRESGSALRLIQSIKTY